VQWWHLFVQQESGRKGSGLRAPSRWQRQAFRGDRQRAHGTLQGDHGWRGCSIPRASRHTGDQASPTVTLHVASQHDPIGGIVAVLPVGARRFGLTGRGRHGGAKNGREAGRQAGHALIGRAASRGGIARRGNPVPPLSLRQQGEEIVPGGRPPAGSVQAFAGDEAAIKGRRSRQV
jgi:hypothetical protein